jgi:hypothetical protein
MTRQKALESIAQTFVSMRYTDLTIAEKSVLDVACRSLGWRVRPNEHGEVEIMKRTPDPGLQPKQPRESK